MGSIAATATPKDAPVDVWGRHPNGADRRHGGPGTERRRRSVTRCTARSRPWLGSARCGPDPSTPDGSVAGICVPHPLLEGQTFCFALLPKDVHKETSGGFVIAGAAPPSTSVPSTRHERNAAIADVQLRLVGECPGNRPALRSGGTLCRRSRGTSYEPAPRDCMDSPADKEGDATRRSAGDRANAAAVGRPAP